MRDKKLPHAVDSVDDKKIAKMPDGFAVKQNSVDNDLVRDKLVQTSSHEKIWKYLYYLGTEDKDFISEVMTIRKELNIPETGYRDVLLGKSKYSGNEFIKWPPEVKSGLLRDRAAGLAEKYGLDISWIDVIENVIVYSNLNISAEHGSMIHVEEILSALTGQYTGHIEDDTDILKSMAEQFPIAILLSPYVSERDIIDYVKKMYKVEIEPRLKNYRKRNIKLGVVRKKSERVRRRNEFIWTNRNLPIKKLMSKLSDELNEVLDYTYVQKIIATEAKKRSVHG